MTLENNHQNIENLWQYSTLSLQVVIVSHVSSGAAGHRDWQGVPWPQTWGIGEQPHLVRLTSRPDEGLAAQVGTQ